MCGIIHAFYGWICYYISWTAGNYSCWFIPRGLLDTRTIDSPIHHWAFPFYIQFSSLAYSPRKVQIHYLPIMSLVLPPLGDYEVMDNCAIMFSFFLNNVLKLLQFSYSLHPTFPVMTTERLTYHVRTLGLWGLKHHFRNFIQCEEHWLQSCETKISDHLSSQYLIM